MDLYVQSASFRFVPPTSNSNSTTQQSVQHDSHQAVVVEVNKENSNNTVHPYFDCEIRTPFSPYGHRQFNLFNPKAPQNTQHPHHKKDRLSSLIDGHRKKKSLRPLGKLDFNLLQKNSRVSCQKSCSDLAVQKQSLQKLKKRLILGGVDAPQKEKHLHPKRLITKESLQKKSLKRLRNDEAHSSNVTKRPCLQNEPAALSTKITQHNLVNTNHRVGTKSVLKAKPPHRVVAQKLNQINPDVRKNSDFTPSWFLSTSPGNNFGYVPSLPTSPTTKELLKGRLGVQLMPVFNKYGSATKAIAPDGSLLRRSAKTNKINTYTASATKPNRCAYDKSKAKLDSNPSYAPLKELDGFIILDESRLDDFFGARKKWSTTQGKVMGISAEEAAIAAGVEVQGQFHWLHLFAFSMGGKNGVEPNEEQNLILGTAGANGLHLRMEDTIKGLVRTHGQIYVRYSIDPMQSEFDAKWHLCGKFTYEFGLVKPDLVEDYRLGKVSEDRVKGACLNSIPIDTLDTRFPSLTDYTFFSASAEIAYERTIAKEIDVDAMTL